MGAPLLLTHKRAPGDITCMSAAVRDIALNYPGQYDLHIYTSCRSLWDHNPYIKKAHLTPPTNIPRLDLTYGHHIRQANKKMLHFATTFHRNFEEQTGVPVPVLRPGGDLHLDDWHKKNPPVSGRYWYVLSGGKSDFTTKVWSAMRHQQYVNVLRQFGVQFVQDGAYFQGHWHPPLEGVLNLCGKTNLRDMLWLIYHADGVICPITFAMHAAAALDRPCVCIAGGREHWWWEAYSSIIGLENFGPHCAPIRVPHRYLHTQDQLDCCMGRGCWKNKVTKAEVDKHKSYCKYPEDDGFGQVIPLCLKNITVNHVVEAVLSYYQQDTLPPVRASRGEMQEALAAT